MQEQYDLFTTNPGISGYRLDYLEIYNWGTFNGTVYRIAPEGNNSLLTGANASGKSTLIDALLTLLVPFKKDRFYNQSSGNEKKGDRTEETYVLGNYGNIQSDGESSITMQRLRDKNTYSIILASFKNNHDKIVTLFQVRWFVSGELKCVYGFSTAPLTINEDFQNFDGSKGEWRRTLEKKYNAGVQKKRIEFYDVIRDYRDRIISTLGLRSEKALTLFNQVVGVKVLNDLDDFIRNNMLEQRDAEEEYVRLNDSFSTLINAKTQIEMKRNNFTTVIVSVVLLVSVIFSSLAAMPASAATVTSDSSVSSGWDCATPHIDVTSIHQRGQSIGFRWNRVIGASRYRIFYRDGNGTWRNLGDTSDNQWYDHDLSRTCKGAIYTVRCVSNDAKRFISGYDAGGVGTKCWYYSTPNVEYVKTVNWNKAYVFFEGNPNVINDGGRFQIYMKKGKNGNWTRIGSTIEKWEQTPEVRTDYDGKRYYPMCYRAVITNDSVPYPGETYYYTVRCIGYANKLLDNGRVGYGEIFISQYNNSDEYYIHHAK